MSISVANYPLGSVADEAITFVVIVSREKDRWLYCRHGQRQTWEIPGGHREAWESCQEAARRELYEETGALQSSLLPVCVYGVIKDDAPPSYGALYFAQVQERGPLPPLEIAEVRPFAQPPLAQTYPNIQPFLWQWTCDFLTKQGK
ncbi:MAG: NUDIX domain-containing protein [Eubacteriales bacterium]|nr:NUDIX domain-containing protein [Eubacteriales bacterium]